MYWHALTGEKRKQPGDDMLSRLTQVTVDRGDGEETGLDDIEITGFAVLLGGAGAETVTKLVGNAVGALLAAPRSVAQGLRRPRQDPVGSRRDPPVPAAVAVPGTVLRAGARAGGWHRSRGLPRAPPHRRGDARPARVRARRRVRHPTATRDQHRVRPRRAQLPRRRAGSHGEPHRDRRDREALAPSSTSTSPVCAG